MNPAKVLQVVTEALDHVGVPYMITGSFASNYQVFTVALATSIS